MRQTRSIAGEAAFARWEEGDAGRRRGNMNDYRKYVPYLASCHACITILSLHEWNETHPRDRLTIAGAKNARGYLRNRGIL